MRRSSRSSWFLAFELRFDHGLPVYYDTLLRRTILLVVVIKVAVFLLFGFHRRWWRYVSVRDMWSAARGVVVASLVADVTVYLVVAGAQRAPAALDRGRWTCSSRWRSSQARACWPAR